MECLPSLFSNNNKSNRKQQKNKSRKDGSSSSRFLFKNKSDDTSSSTDSTKSTTKTTQELLDELSHLTIVGLARAAAAKTNDTPLHVACEYHYSDDLIMNVLLKGEAEATQAVAQAAAQAAAQAVNNGNNNDANTNANGSISAVYKENARGDLPLHSAMRDTTINVNGDDSNNSGRNGYGGGYGSGVSEKVFEKLLSMNKSAVEHLNNSDCLPIHIACDRPNFNTNVEVVNGANGAKGGAANKFVIDRLLQFYPESVMIHSKIRKPFDGRGAGAAVMSSSSIDTQTLYGADSGEGINLLNCNVYNSDSASGSGSGLYKHFMDSIDNLRETFLRPAGKNNQHSFDDNDHDDDNNGSSYETDLTPLHLAVMTHASPDIIASLLNANSYCLNLKTSRGRTAIDIAKAVAMSKSSSTPTKNNNSNNVEDDDDEDEDGVAGSIEIMESYARNVTNVLSLRVVSQALIDATAEDILKGNFKLSQEKNDSDSDNDVVREEKKDPKKLWRKATVAVRFIHKLTSSLGPMNDIDNDQSMIAPPNYVPPAGLDLACVDITLPVGFRQLRWGLLSHASSFHQNFHEEKMNYSEFTMTPWNKHNDKIGEVGVDKNSSIDEHNFLGATRNVNYLMPKTMVVPANTAYTTETIVEYTNYCIAIKRVSKNPDVPFGKTFECHCLDVFINTGYNTCRMITTTQAVFYGKPPMIAWKIKNAMKNGVTEKSIALGESICDIRASYIQFSGGKDQ